MLPRHANGFSLVELSIVLVVIALLVGGILGGRSLIKAAELRSVMNEASAWQTAVQTFRSRYNEYPGDFSQATQYWSGTGNGNGDGRIGGTTLNERFRFWQHLSLAGLIPGTYTGVAASGGPNAHVAGQNAPASKYPNAGWSIESVYGGYPAIRYNLDYHNALMFGAPTGPDPFYGPLLAPEEAWGIDVKMDDGKPGRGSVVAIWYTACGGASADNHYDSDYVLSDRSPRCALYFRGLL